MGAGIAHAFLMAGADVTVVERDDRTAEAARERVVTAVDRSLAREPSAGAREWLLEALAVGVDANVFTGSELVVEAVPEDLELKRSALARIAAATDGSCVIATNTSSVPIDELAAAVADPARFLGMHFFNPVPASALVEVVVGAATDPAVVRSARAWVTALGKRAIVVHDSPGFASSRLGVLLGLEAIRMLEEGVADAADIDAALELGYRHPVGPLRTTDIVGLDVRLGIAEELHARLGERFAPPELLRRMVAEGRTGRKAGRGFYEWSEG